MNGRPQDLRGGFVRIFAWIWRPTHLYVASTLLFAGWAAVNLVWPPSFRSLDVELDPEEKPDQFAAAWRIGIDRFMEFEGFMVQIGAVLLGALAFLAGMLFGKESMLLVDEQDRGLVVPGEVRASPKARLRKHVFGLILAIVGTASLAYIHVAKVMLTYAAYVVHLESKLDPSPVQVITEAAHFIDSRPFSGVLSMLALCLFPAIPLLVCIWGFGQVLGIDKKNSHCLTAIAVLSIAMFIVPESMGIVQLLRGSPEQ